MSEQPIQDINDGKPWSEMDLFDLRNSLAYGRSIEEVAGFLCRSGTVEACARSAALVPSGHVAAAPPRSDMNSRRHMGSPPEAGSRTLPPRCVKTLWCIAAKLMAE
jgi:hypothetical protein